MRKWTEKANCYGYATNTPAWLLFDADNSWGKEGVEELMFYYPHWKLVERKDMVLGKEYVAYRFGKGDFHFMFRNKKGYWRHKMGANPVMAISTKIVFGTAWYFGGAFYNSKLYLFEV